MLEGFVDAYISLDAKYQRTCFPEHSVEVPVDFVVTPVAQFVLMLGDRPAPYVGRWRSFPGGQMQDSTRSRPCRAVVSVVSCTLGQAVDLQEYLTP